jgi:glycosyltransferase involved in cell wall biosynthesis
MRVLFFSSIFPRPWNPTLGIYCFHACRAMERLGHEVRVISPRSWLDRPKAPRPLPGLDALDVEYPLYVYPPRILHSRAHRFMALSSQRAMERAHRSFRPDGILSYWAHPDGDVAARFARKWGIPSGVIIGGSDVLVLPKQDRARGRSILRALRSIDAAITVGKHLADATVALGVPREKVHVVYQGVDTDAFSTGSMAEARKRLGIAEDCKVLVTVGSLVPVKGIDVLLRALARMKRVDVHLYLVGGGAARPSLEALATELGLAPNVHFVGSVPQNALGDWYRAADATVLSSRSEGVPNVLRESLACGAPFVATNVGGVFEIAEGTANRVVPPEDPIALEAAISATLNEPRPQVPPGTFLTWDESTRQLLDVLFRGRA